MSTFYTCIGVFAVFLLGVSVGILVNATMTGRMER